jgi:prephenate dehydratase
MQIAIQGERGSFSHQAALEISPRAGVLPCARIVDVFDALDSRHAGAAVVPVENTLAGSVGEHLDLLLERDVFVHGELNLRIEHNLIVAPGARFKNIRYVLSHPVALDQCREFLRRHRKLVVAPFYDTAGAVKHIMAGKLRDTAAIASRGAAREYGAKILTRGVEDDKKNYTRFFLVQKGRKIPPRADKTSLAFSVRNVPGALFKALSVFALRDLDLSKIQSRPVRGRPWEYSFFIDVRRGDDAAMRLALRHLEEVAGFVKLLGVYRGAK